MPDVRETIASAIGDHAADAALSAIEARFARIQNEYGCDTSVCVDVTHGNCACSHFLLEELFAAAKEKSDA